MKMRLIATISISLLLLSTIYGTALAANNVEFADTNVPSLNGNEDFGDAPLPYPTILALGGASHIIVPVFCLGSLIDGEPDGQPHPNALGDDIVGLADEDGVLFVSPIQQGQIASINVMVTNLIGPLGFLDAWVDFNADGDWSDAGEQIFAGLPVPPGIGSYLFQFAIPPNASIGPTFARFRLHDGSMGPSLPPFGPGREGEVEDYMIRIEGPPTGTIIVEKQTDPDGAPDTFTFGGDATGSIKDNEQIVVSNLLPGTYRSQEVVPAGWSLTSIVLDDGNSSGDVNTATATFQLEAGETVKAVFYNTKSPPTPPIEVGGDVYPVNRLAILAPWMALAVVIIAGAIIAVRRRRTQS